MSRILDLIDGYMNGDAWENLCVSCYRIKYQKYHYVSVPAAHGGDTGVEGYTKNGIVHQCYCPERIYSDDVLYEHQRDKLSADITLNSQELVGIVNNLDKNTYEKINISSKACN